MTVVVDGSPLTIEDVWAVACQNEGVSLAAGVANRMEPARRLVEQWVAEGRTVYGVTTGFGALANTRVDPDRIGELQLNLLRSHAAGVGPPIPDSWVRAMLLLRARTLSQGHSGVRFAVVRALVDLLAHDLLPVVPNRGSVGASGDLAQFAHLALPLVGEGLVRRDGEVIPAGPALAATGLEPLHLEAKEGLSLLNGTEGMAAIAALSVVRLERLQAVADLACAMTVEALMGSARPFRTEIHRLRPHPGQIASADAIARNLAGSAIGASHADDFTHAVQDAYCIRCAPQVHGAARETIGHLRRVVEVELGSVVDNPIVLPDSDEIVSAGNFHGQPLAFAMDFAAIAAAELSSISERRTDRMLDPQHSNGLPAFLAPSPGLTSGYMLAQYTAAALVAENRLRAQPASVDSIPTSGSQEDHVSMGWGAGLDLQVVLDNLTLVLAVELLCGAQGVEYRRPLTASPTTEAALALIRDYVPTLEADRPIGEDIEKVAALISDNRFEEVTQ